MSRRVARVYAPTEAQMARDYVPKYHPQYQPEDLVVRHRLVGPQYPEPKAKPTGYGLPLRSADRPLANPAAVTATVGKRGRPAAPARAAPPPVARPASLPARALAVMASEPERLWTSVEIAARLADDALKPKRIVTAIQPAVRRGEVFAQRVQHGNVRAVYRLTAAGRQRWAGGA